MLTKLDHFLNHWFDGLLRPVRITQNNPQIAKLGDSNIVVWPESKNKHKRVYLLIPDNLMLNSPIPTTQGQNTAHDLVEQLLPFKNDEVFATSDTDTLLAVLKSDIESHLSQTNEFGKKLSGIVFNLDDKYHFVDTTALKQRASLSLKMLAALLAGLLMFYGSHFWLHNKNEQQITSLRQTLSQLKTSNIELENFDLTLTGATVDTTLSGLYQTNKLLNLNSKVDQISLRSTTVGLELVMDATSASAIDQLTKFSTNEHFEEVDFVSAISQNTFDSNERYRLIATFKSSVEETPKSTNVKAGVNQDEE